MLINKVKMIEFIFGEHKITSATRKKYYKYVKNHNDNT